MINIDQSIFPFNMPKVSSTVKNDSSVSGIQNIVTGLNNEKQVDEKQEKKNINIKFIVGLAVFGACIAAILSALKVPKINMTLEQFKSRKGRFDKGIAKIENKPYSGIIVVEKNKKNFILSYKEGRIVLSTCLRKVDCVDTPLASFLEFKKKYSYGTDNRIIEYFKYAPNGTEYLTQKTIFGADEVVSEKSNRYIDRKLKSRVVTYPNGDVFSTSEVIEKTDNPKVFKIKTVNSATGEVLNSEIVLSNKQTIVELVEEICGDTQMPATNGKVIQINKIGTNESGEKFAIVNDGSSTKEVVLEPKNK